ncbi:putative low complexity protein [Cryptosporidium felis]|nr:putative low complexity protein [Cryptosporidium felis]
MAKCGFNFKTSVACNTKHELFKVFCESELKKDQMPSLKFKAIDKPPNWWRGSENEDILDPCFKKPIYSGNSNFNFFPKFLNDNIEWFKNRKTKFCEEVNIEYEQYREYNKEYFRQKKMVQKQDNSRYKFISPYSEYLLERMKWKIALRIYYTLDPNKKGFIELEQTKKILFDMLETDTEMAQTLLVFIETIRPFFVKDGCIEKNGIISYLVREIADDTRGYGLFSKLYNIFKNPLSRAKRLSNNFDQGLQKPFRKEICHFSSEPEKVKLNLLGKCHNNNIELIVQQPCFSRHCRYRNGHCVTNAMKYGTNGKLKDHIRRGKERKQKLIEKIKNEQKIKNQEEIDNCKFKPEIIWPINNYLKKEVNKYWSENVKKKTKSKKGEKKEIMGYVVIDDQDSVDKNVEVHLDNSMFNQNFDFDKNWNEYIHDSISNQVFISHEGHIFGKGLRDVNEIFFRNTDREEQKENRFKRLESIAKKTKDEFHALEELGKDEKNPNVMTSKKRLIEKLKMEREMGMGDPRLNTPEFIIDTNNPAFNEKVVDLSKLEPYKEVGNHEKNIKKDGYTPSPFYYYLPKGYEKIGNCFNEYHLKRKFYFNNPDRENINNKVKPQKHPQIGSLNSSLLPSIETHKDSSSKLIMTSKRVNNTTQVNSELKSNALGISKYVSKTDISNMINSPPKNIKNNESSLNSENHKTNISIMAPKGNNQLKSSSNKYSVMKNVDFQERKDTFNSTKISISINETIPNKNMNTQMEKSNTLNNCEVKYLESSNKCVYQRKPETKNTLLKVDSKSPISSKGCKLTEIKESSAQVNVNLPKLLNNQINISTKEITNGTLKNKGTSTFPKEINLGIPSKNEIVDIPIKADLPVLENSTTEVTRVHSITKNNQCISTKNKINGNPITTNLPAISENETFTSSKKPIIFGKNADKSITIKENNFDIKNKGESNSTYVNGDQPTLSNKTNILAKKSTKITSKNEEMSTLAKKISPGISSNDNEIADFSAKAELPILKTKIIIPSKKLTTGISKNDNTVPLLKKDSPSIPSNNKTPDVPAKTDSPILKTKIIIPSKKLTTGISKNDDTVPLLKKDSQSIPSNNKIPDVPAKTDSPILKTKIIIPSKKLEISVSKNTLSYTANNVSNQNIQTKKIDVKKVPPVLKGKANIQPKKG